MKHRRGMFDPNVAVQIMGIMGIALIAAVGQATEVLGEVSGWAEFVAFGVVVALLTWFMKAFMAQEREHRQEERAALTKSLADLAERHEKAMSEFVEERREDRQYRTTLRDRVTEALAHQTRELTRLAAAIEGQVQTTGEDS